MANSADPDQTALGLHCLYNYASLSDTLVFEILGQLLYCLNIYMYKFTLISYRPPYFSQILLIIGLKIFMYISSDTKCDGYFIPMKSSQLALYIFCMKFTFHTCIYFCSYIYIILCHTFMNKV